MSLSGVHKALFTSCVTCVLKIAISSEEAPEYVPRTSFVEKTLEIQDAEKRHTKCEAFKYFHFACITVCLLRVRTYSPCIHSLVDLCEAVDLPSIHVPYKLLQQTTCHPTKRLM